MEKLSSHIFLFARDYRTMTSGWPGEPYPRRHGQDLASKTAVSFKKSGGGLRYRRTTLPGENVCKHFSLDTFLPHGMVYLLYPTLTS